MARSRLAKGLPLRPCLLLQSLPTAEAASVCRRRQLIARPPILTTAPASVSIVRPRRWIPSWVTQSIQELEVHSRLLDEMGMLRATPYNKVARPWAC